ncbi:MAG: DNA-3-methyladenine glycosylase [Opitutaceae bacterium]|nr:DNA-3-methyladenine glycosylase [Cytophagales bacterium]
MGKLGKEFYLNKSVTEVAVGLLGKRLCTNINGQLSIGKIVETEAYSGRNDKACHANNGRRTKRNEVMYAEGGLAYVYFCYGIHSMFNVVTNIIDQADAVLIRAVEPMVGIDIMMARRGVSKPNKVSSGPGNVCKALGIQLNHNQISLLDDEIWIEDGNLIAPEEVIAKPRVGVDYAGEDALLLWRYYIKENLWISKK